MEADERAGKLIGAALVTDAWVKILSAIKTGVLWMPDNLAPQLAAADDAREAAGAPVSSDPRRRVLGLLRPGSFRVAQGILQSGRISRREALGRIGTGAAWGLHPDTLAGPTPWSRCGPSAGAEQLSSGHNRCALFPIVTSFHALRARCRGFQSQR